MSSLSMDFTAYSTDDFLADESFQAYIVEADPAATQFWSTWLLQHPAKEREIKEAISLLTLLAAGKRQLPSAGLIKTETAKLWAAIQSSDEASQIA